MKPLKIVAAAAGVIFVILALVIAIQPEQAHLEKSIVINAPDSVIFPHISNFRKLSDWWPWSKMDAELKTSYEGIDGTVGSKVIWSGAKAGTGAMYIESLEPYKRVKSVMTIDGQKEKSYSEFVLNREGSGTKITWTYNGINDGLAGKAKWLVMGTLLGSQYDLGLKDLKKVIEEDPTRR